MGRRARKSFALRLILSYIFIVIVSFVFVALFLDKNLEETSLKEIQSSLLTQARLIEHQIPVQSLKNEDASFLETLAQDLKPKMQCRMTVITATGKVLADSDKSPEDTRRMENHINRPEVMTALRGSTGIDTRYSATLKMDMLYVAIPIIDNAGIAGVLRLALPLESVQRKLSGIRRIIFAGLLFALGLACALGFLIAGKTIRPINRIIQVSRKFSEGDFSRRIMLNSKDEIQELAETLNRMAQDIEDKIREIKTQNQKLAAIFNSMIEGVIVVDKTGHVVSVNPTVEKIFGVSNAEAKGRLFLEAVRNNDISEVVNSVLATGKPEAKEIHLVLPVRGTFQINAAPIFDNETVSGSLAVIHDITEMRRLETMRKDFVANVSHELKTPLTSIKGFTETLLEGALEDKEHNRNFLKIIQEHAGRLNKLVDDLLSLSHLESKEITLEKEDVPLRQMAEEVISGFKAQVQKKKLEIINELPESLAVKADKDRLEQVVTNLIDNAIKFNKEQGFLKLYCLKVPGAVKVTVEDSGIGVPEKDIPRIFERFYRVDKARSRELGGTGLGLSIVKHIVELHGGTAGVESIEGLGSKFWFTLPK